MIPIRIDKRLNRTPLVNYGLILANVFVFIFIQRMTSQNPALVPHLLNPDEPRLSQFFSSAFMHANWAHLFGNMVFLWVFGNAVNDSFGHLGYLAFYLAGGVCAGLGYVLLSGTAPVLGASGAISAVTGAFLVLFPRVRVTVLVFLPFLLLMPFEVSSLFFLLLQFAWNVYASWAPAGTGVAYVAHASGYVFGIGIAAGLLAIKLLPRDVYDLLSLIRTWRRRQSYRRAVTGGYDPFSPTAWQGRQRAPFRRRVDARTVATKPLNGPEARQLELRRQIGASHARGDLPAAAAGYLKLIQIAEDAVLPAAQQLDVANHLMSAEQYPAAADAYERFLRHYPRYEYPADIRLMLGLIYSRYLHQDAQAESYLSHAVPDLTDASKLELARSELEKVRQRLR